MRSATIFLLSFFFAISVFGQDEFTQSIKGNIIDKDADYPLIGVNVLLIGSDAEYGTSTDIDGNFKLSNVPVGRQALQISYIGYKTVTLPNILVSTGKETVLDIQMEEDLTKLDEVVITSQQDKRKDGKEGEQTLRLVFLKATHEFYGVLGLLEYYYGEDKEENQ